MTNLEALYCSPSTSVLEILTIFEEAKRLSLPSGITLVLDNNQRVIGTVTEGDIRRALLQTNSLETKAELFMQQNPILFDEGLSLSEILEKLPIELSKRNRNSNKYLSKIILVDAQQKPVRIIDYHELWEQKVASHRHLVVVGLGYVGLTLAAVMADAGFMVTGVDVDTKRIEQLNNGQSYIHEIGLQELLNEQISKNLFVSTQVPADGDVYIISVGTPVESSADGSSKGPVLKYLESACAAIGSNLKRGNLVVLRSTVPIGTCRNFVKEQLEQQSGLTCGIDFHLSFAPERTAEGKALKELRSLPQIIGGYNNDSLEATAAIFRDLTPTIIKVESLEAAEMAKLINNTYRDYIFAFANQMAKMASQFNINIHDVIRAANEGYPRDTVPYPSPGVGGPCLTKDPHIFASVADAHQLNKDLFINGRSINESMHSYVAQHVIDQLKVSGKDLKTARIVVCGLAFKGNPETGDIRNSSAIDIVHLLKSQTPVIYGYDAVADKQEMIECGVIPVSLDEAFVNADAVLFLNNHKSFEKLNVFDMVRSMNNHPIVFDGWNLFRADDILSAKPCTYMGISFTRSSI